MGLNVPASGLGLIDESCKLGSVLGEWGRSTEMMAGIGTGSAQFSLYYLLLFSPQTL